MIYQKSIERIEQFDVVVVGGGVAGFCAAVAAGRQGKRTALIEDMGALGGIMTTGGNPQVGIFYAYYKQAIAGIGWELCKNLEKMGFADVPDFSVVDTRKGCEPSNVKVCMPMAEAEMNRMCEEAGVHVICNAMISYAQEKQSAVNLIVTTKDGMVSIHASAAVDATGDATLCQLLGFKLLKSNVQQPATLQNHISGYVACEKIFDQIKKSFDPMLLPPHIKEDDLIGYLKQNRINMHVPCVDADTSVGRTQLEKNARFEMMKVVCFLRKIEGLENLTVDFAANETGVRETNRIEGEHIITEDEYINGYIYPDSVCYAFYPIDLHVERGIEQRFHEENVVSKIPYSALIPKNARRVLCAGRCVSSDTYANSALRVEAACMAMGQVAGAAASVMVQENADAAEITYGRLCAALRSVDAIVPDEL